MPRGPPLPSRICRRGGLAGPQRPRPAPAARVQTMDDNRSGGLSCEEFCEAVGKLVPRAPPPPPLCPRPRGAPDSAQRDLSLQRQRTRALALQRS